MTPFRRIGIVSLCLALAAAAVLPALRAAPPAPSAPPASPAASAAAARGAEDLMKEVGAIDEKISDLMPTPTLLADPDFRAGDGQKVLPQLQSAVGLMAELEKAIRADPRLKDAADLIDQVHAGRFHAMAYAATLGDKAMAAALEAQAKEKSPDGIAAAAALTLSQWLAASKDAAAQRKILDDFTAVAKDNAENEEVLATLAVMINLGPANAELEKKVVEVIRANMKGPMVKPLLAQLDGEQEQKALVGQPLALSGRTSTGGTFNTADYKGKVVMLDFWATWCGPCLAELPNVKKAYATYHDQGFEIVGLSCDTGDDVLNAFIKEKDMPWVQLRESTQNEEDRWHPLAKKYHVDGIPQMFLIDRNGVLRYIDARENLDKKIALLVAEAAGKPAESRPGEQK